MRRMLFLLAGAALLGVILACNLTSPRPGTPPPDLVATQVALAFTQTAVAAEPTAVPTAQPPTAVPTAAPPSPTAPPVPPSPTATARPVSPPYDGPCTPALTAPTGTTPHPNAPRSFIGYRYDRRLGELFPEYHHRPYFGFLLSSSDLGTRAPGFALSAYERGDLGILALFLEREVCRQADGSVYWEIADALSLPLPAKVGDFLFITARHSMFPPNMSSATALNLGLGWYATLDCPPPLHTQPVAVVHINPAALPPAIRNGTRIAVTLVSGWTINPSTQRFEPFNAAAFSCLLEFHG